MSIQPVPDALAGEKMICADFFNLENGATVFMVTGSLSADVTIRVMTLMTKPAVQLFQK